MCRRRLTFLASLHEIAERNFSVRFQIDILALRALAFAARETPPRRWPRCSRQWSLPAPAASSGSLSIWGRRCRRSCCNWLGRRMPSKPCAASWPRSRQATARRPRPYAGFGIRAANTGLLDPLTSRELEVLALLPERLSTKEIAHRLGLAPTTVKRHTANLYGKLGVNKRWDAVIKAEALGILPHR